MILSETDKHRKGPVTFVFSGEVVRCYRWTISKQETVECTTYQCYACESFCTKYCKSDKKGTSKLRFNFNVEKKAVNFFRFFKIKVFIYSIHMPETTKK